MGLYDFMEKLHPSNTIPLVESSEWTNEIVFAVNTSQLVHGIKQTLFDNAMTEVTVKLLSP